MKKYFYFILYLFMIISGCQKEANVEPSQQSIVFKPLTAEITFFDNTNLSITWEDSITSVVSYAIDASSNGIDFALMTNVNADNKYFSITGNYSSNTKYYYRVRAIGNENKTVSFSNILCGSPYFLPPTKLTFEFIPDSVVLIKWKDKSEGEDRFEIEQSRDSLNFSLAGFASANAEEYRVTGKFSISDNYYFRVRAKRGSEYTDFSRTIKYSPIFSAPFNLSMITENATRIKLTWESEYNFSPSYKIERADNDGGFVEIGTVNNNSTLQFYDDNLNSANKYKYRVRAFTTNNYSQYSDELKIKTDSVNGAFLKEFDGICDIGFSSDEKLLACFKNSGTISFYNTSSGTLASNLTGFDFLISDNNNYGPSLAFSPGGKYFAAGSCEYTSGLPNRIYIWDLKTKEIIKIITPNNRITSLVFSPNDSYIAAASDNKIECWLTSSWEKKFSFGCDFMTYNYDISYSPDNKYFMGEQDNGTLNIWDLGSNSIIKSIKCGGVWRKRIAFDKNWNKIAVSYRGNISIYNYDSTKKMMELNDETGLPHFSDSPVIKFSNDGRFLLRVGTDGKIRLWDTYYGKLAYTINSGGTKIIFSSDGTYLASLETGGKVKLWAKIIIWVKD